MHVATGKGFCCGLVFLSLQELHSLKIRHLWVLLEMTQCRNSSCLSSLWEILGYRSEFWREVKDFRQNASARVCSKGKWNRKFKWGSGTQNINCFILKQGTGREGNGFGVSAAIVTGSSNTTYPVKMVISLLPQLFQIKRQSGQQKHPDWTTYYVRFISVHFRKQRV